MKVYIQLFILLSLAIDCLAKKQTQNLSDLQYKVFPRRTTEEAAIIEWGYSGEIAVLDASVAHFGPQTSDAAMMEVECKPILADPLHGVSEGMTRDSETGVLKLAPLQNAKETEGNMVVMTTNGGMSGVEMARVAKLSGAVALLVVNTDEENPDDIFRLPLLENENADDIDIPVVMISIKSANVLTTVTITPGMNEADIVNNGMPNRVRLYAGVDRPFFEEIYSYNPALYLIHNTISEEQSNEIIRSARTKVSPLVKDDLLQLSTQMENYPGVERAVLWQGVLQTPSQKEISERIEQVTGFPVAHHSDWVVDKLEPGAFWKPHHDVFADSTTICTITVFLSDAGGPIVYPSAKEPIKIFPRQGMAVVHHNTDDMHKVDITSLHALMPNDSDGPVYLARKFVFMEPVSNARRIALPVIALLCGGKLPGVISYLHTMLIEQFGIEQGSKFFDQACVFVPVLIFLLVASMVGDYWTKSSKGKKAPKLKRKKKD